MRERLGIHGLGEAAYAWRGAVNMIAVFQGGYVIQIHAGPNDLHKLLQRVSAERQPGRIWSEIAGNDVRKITSGTRKRAEIVAPAQVHRGIYLGGLLAKIGYSGRRVFCRRAG